MSPHEGEFLPFPSSTPKKTSSSQQLTLGCSATQPFCSESVLRKPLLSLTGTRTQSNKKMRLTLWSPPSVGLQTASNSPFSWESNEELQHTQNTRQFSETHLPFNLSDHPQLGVHSQTGCSWTPTPGSLLQLQAVC